MRDEKVDTGGCLIMFGILAFFGFWIGLAVFHTYQDVESLRLQKERIEGKEEGFTRFCHQVPSLNNGDMVFMDDGVYLVIKPATLNSHNVTLFRAKDSHERILHGGIKGSGTKERDQVIEDFLSTKKVVRKDSPEWPKLYTEQWGGISN